MEPLKYVLSEELSDDTFLQYTQAVWAEFTELAPEELKAAPPFKQFAADLVQLEKAVVTKPLFATGEEQTEEQAQTISEARHQMTLSYRLLIEQLDQLFSADISPSCQLLEEGLRTARKDTQLSQRNHSQHPHACQSGKG